MYAKIQHYVRDSRIGVSGIMIYFTVITTAVEKYRVFLCCLLVKVEGWPSQSGDISMMVPYNPYIKDFTVRISNGNLMK